MTNVTPERLARLLRSYRFRHTSEDALQRAIVQVLTNEGIPFEREVKLGPKDRIDFMLPGGVGIELKVKGSATNVARQLQRYAKSDRITALVLVTSRLQAGVQLDAYLGKPVHVVNIQSFM